MAMDDEKFDHGEFSAHPFPGYILLRPVSDNVTVIGEWIVNQRTLLLQSNWVGTMCDLTECKYMNLRLLDPTKTDFAYEEIKQIETAELLNKNWRTNSTNH